MRIGMMVDLYKPHISGVTNYVELNKRFLEEAGHQVYVFTFGNENFPDDEVNVIRTPGLPFKDTDLQFNLTYNKRARQILYTMDVAHVHHPFLSGTLALRYCRPRSIPIIFTNHTRYDLYAQAYLPMLPEAVGEAAMKTYLPPFCRACDLVISPSQGMADVLTRFGVDSGITVVPNGVELERFFAPLIPIERAELGIPDIGIVLAYIGRVAPEKNLAFLLRAFNGVAEAFPDVHLLIVGSGPELENIQSQAANLNQGSRIHFTGFIPYDQLPQYLAVVDAFVTSSVSEVHPLSVIEAMAAGLPVLGISSPGIKDTVNDNHTGFLASNDLAAFTAKMVRIVTEHKLRKRMGQNAREASKIYDIRLTSKLMLGHYERLVQEASDHHRGLRYRALRLMDKWR
jgi:glycosyltransferase involved in cell wall biosynthesis